jgi:putative two-component system protein, hydrogenase maturation factor HypX/HoxX
VRVLLLASSFNGVTQRAWCALRSAGHEVSVELAIDEKAMISGAELADPHVIICPFLKERIPEQVWSRWPTIVIHPGPVGDRGPSSLDWAITEVRAVWGVTALQAVEEMDAGPIWATRTFPMPSGAPRKSSLYNGPVADAALDCVLEVVQRAATPGFVPVPLAVAARPVGGTGRRPLMRQADRAFSWNDEATAIVRRIRAADGAPGVRTTLAGHAVSAFDAHVAPSRVDGRPGDVVGRDGEAVLVAAGARTGVWIGRLKAILPDGTPGVKLPAVEVLRGALNHVPILPGGRPEIAYVRRGPVGELHFDMYNGALSTRQCHRLADALRAALAEDTRVLLVRGGTDAFCNGIHLNVIEAAADPAAEAWANIRAINSVCRLLAADTRQVIIVGLTGNAGAGGAMLPLGADLVAARANVVLNPYYDMGLFGSELHTYTLPARVGRATAQRLLGERLPVDAAEAHRLGMVDLVGPADPDMFTGWLREVANEYAADDRWSSTVAARRDRIAAMRRPLSYYEVGELAQMAADLFDDRQEFAAKRKAFVHKHRSAETPLKLARHRQLR